MESTNNISTFKCTKCQLPCLDSENSICCDDCDEWTHLSCTKLTVKQFQHLSSSDTKFYCPSCHLKSICPICSKVCRHNQNCILCDKCDKWLHIKCIKLDIKEFRKLSNSHCQFFCEICIANSLPFHTEDNFSLNSFFNDTYNIHNSLLVNTDNLTTLDSDLYMSPKAFKNNYHNEKCLSVLSINIRSLNKNFDRLESLICRLGFEPDIISVNETWINDNKGLIYSLKGYSFIFTPCDGMVGGTGFFIKSSINFSIVNDISINLDNCEDKWIKISLPNNNNLIIGSIYRHPSYLFRNFETRLVNIIEHLTQGNKKFLIVGDFNIDLMQNTPSITRYKNEIFSLGCIQTVSNFTRISHNRNKNSLLDHVYSNLNENQLITKTLSHEISDHLPTVVLIDSCKTKPDSFTRKLLVRDQKHFNLDNFLIHLQNDLLKLSSRLNYLNSEDCWDAFENIFNNVLNEHAPLRPQSRKERKRHKKPWLTRGILKSIKTKQKLYNEVVNQKNSNITFSFYKKFRNKLTRVIELAKKTYFKSELKHSNSDPKKLWNTINNIVNVKKAKAQNNVKIINQDGQILEDSADMAEAFNSFFTDIGKNLSSKIVPPDSNCKITPTSNVYKSQNSFFLNPITKYEVEKHINNLDHNKSTKSTCPSVKFLKLSAKTISPILSELFNKCIVEGIFPKSLKSAELIPIFKKGDKTLCSNYRPISILSPLSKVFERHIHSSLTQFITKHNILYKHQYGFRSHSSTEMALSQLSESITSNLENNSITCSIFIDLCKAFDTVDHSILLSKLECYGIRGIPNKLIRNYLSERTQLTLVNGKKSRFKTINCGVPQGSILGPLLFLIYLNDLPNASAFDVRLFADDACLLLNDKNPNNLESKVNEELVKINDWLKINKLSLNYTKTNYIIFSRRKKKDNFKVHIQGNVLQRVSHTKYLGAIVDEKLDWKHHVNHIQKKISRASHFFCKLRHYVSLNTLVMLYYSLVYCHLSYCITSWGGVSKSSLYSLNVLQRRILRIITFSDFQCHSAPLFFNLKLLTITDLYHYKLAILFHGIINNKFTGTSNITRLSNIHKHNTRLSSSINFFQYHSKTNLGLRTFSTAGTQFWRNIPTGIKSLTLPQFKKSLKDYLIASYCHI